MLGEGFNIFVVHHEEIKIQCTQSSTLISHEVAGYGLKVLLFCWHLLCSFSLIRIQWTTSMLWTVSWVRHTTDPLKVLRYGIAFLQDPSKIDASNHEVWCNLHITPALEGIIVEVHAAWRRLPIGPRNSAWGLLQTAHGARSHQLDCCIRAIILGPAPLVWPGCRLPWTRKCVLLPRLWIQPRSVSTERMDWKQLTIT